MGDHVLQVQGAFTQAVQCETSGENKKAKALWSLKETKDKGTDFYDLDSVQKIQTGSQVRLDLWAIQLKSPTAAVASAPKRNRAKMWVGPVISNER